MLHNLEEIIMIERWMKKTYPEIRERLPQFAKRELDSLQTTTAAQFSLVVFILSILASALIVITITTDEYFLFVGLNIIFALNILIHPFQSLLIRCYVPGLWTTILLIIPYYIFFFTQLYHQGLMYLVINLKTIVVFLIFIPVFLISHKISRKWI